MYSSDFLIFVEVANLRIELARARPTVLLFSYFCGGRQSQMELARPDVFLFSYFFGGRQPSN